MKFTSTSKPGAGNPIDRTEWDLDGDGVFGDASGLTAQTSFAQPGPHTVRLRVRGRLGRTDTTSRVVDVANRPPVASFVYSFAGGLATVGTPVTFASSSKDAEGPVSHAWDLDDDGAFDDAEGPIVTATFRTPGEHLVRLLVRDADRATSVATSRVAVAATPVSGPSKPPATGSSVTIPETLLSPFPIVRVVGTVSRSGVRLGLLTIRGPQSASYTLRCRGAGCPFKQFGPRRMGTGGGTQAAFTARTVRIRRFRQRMLRPGARVSVFVSHPLFIGKYTSLKVRNRRRAPLRADRCLRPGSLTPTRCP